MVYTASALSFMLVGLGKPVVLTGAQVPIIGNVIEDGTRNLLGAIICATQEIPEVCVFFDRFLYRGNRASKRNASGLDGFWSPNYPHLAELRDTSGSDYPLAINHDVILKKRSGFSPQIRIDASVIPLRIFPGISGDLLGRIIGIDGLDGMVLEAYGTGNAPSREDFLDALRKAKCVVLDASQCSKGEVHLGQYETGAGLLKCGVLSGSDITPEAALCKMLVLLSNENYGETERGQTAVRRDLERNLAGEQSQSLIRVELEPRSGKQTRFDFVTADQASQTWDQDRVSRVVLNLLGVSLKSTDSMQESVAVKFDAFINLDSRNDGNADHPGFAGFTRKQSNSDAGILTFDISVAKSLIAPNSPRRISLIPDRPVDLKGEKATLMLFVREGRGIT